MSCSMEIEIPVKPRIAVEAKRDPYQATFILRNRRSWDKMSLEDRRAVLLQGAALLEEYAQQMRSEAEQIAV